MWLPERGHPHKPMRSGYWRKRANTNGEGRFDWLSLKERAVGIYFSASFAFFSEGIPKICMKLSLISFFVSKYLFKTEFSVCPWPRRRPDALLIVNRSFARAGKSIKKKSQTFQWNPEFTRVSTGSMRMSGLEFYFKGWQVRPAEIEPKRE